MFGLLSQQFGHPNIYCGSFGEFVINMSSLQDLAPVLQDLWGESELAYELCSAVREGDFAEVAKMLTAQYNPNSSSDYEICNMTALERAVDELHIGIAVLLFVHGADPQNNVYVGEELDHASCSGRKSVDVRPGFEEAFAKDEPIVGFPGLHALLQANQGKRGCTRMRSILFLMEKSSAHQWGTELFRHLRIGFGVGTASRSNARLWCTLLCLKCALPIAVNYYFNNELTAFIMLEEVDVAFQALARANTETGGDQTDDDNETCGHGTRTSHLDLNSFLPGKASTSDAVPVVEDVQHDEQAEVIHPLDAARVIAEIEAGYVEPLATSSADSLGEGSSDTLEHAHESGVQRYDVDVNSPFSCLLMPNFSRHPRSFEASLLHDECLREVREALDRSGLNLRLPSGAFVFVSPDEYHVAMLAVTGERLTASHVIVSQTLQPIVLAAVNSGTSCWG
mmetsp:Transcript_95326/g.188974  ORF Transcript_95326/g.188974 Transcript_95326/m.188974 type:complete len:452 (+) Transcript_95326:1-1356(+)